MSIPVTDFEADDDLPTPKRDGTIVGDLFSSHAKRVRRFLSFRLRNDADAQDATQDIFLRLWKHEQKGTLRDEATNYMFSATHSVAIDVERHRTFVGQELDPETDPDTVLKAQPDQEEITHWRNAMAAFVDSVKALPPKTREVFVLYHFRNMGYDEVAAQLGVSRRTVERHLVQALAQCRKDMERFL